MGNDEFYTFEDRAYVNPTLSSGEQDAFISNLRNAQAQNNAEIAEDTHNLGTDVPSNLGGLGGGEAYFDARYQTPQVNEMVNTLKASAQAQALSDVMSNYQAQLKERYQQAYRAYQKRQRAKARKPSGNGNTSGNNGNTSGWNGNVKTKIKDERDVVSSSSVIPGLEGHDITDYFEPAEWGGTRWTIDNTAHVRYKNGDFDHPIQMSN